MLALAGPGVDTPVQSIEIRHLGGALAREAPAEDGVVLPSASYARLQRIKASYDPDQTIISAHPVRPIGA